MVDVSTAKLSADEQALWLAWKQAGEAVMAGLARDIAAATGLSGAEFGVLSRLVELGHGELRQSELAASMRWDKSRISHQLTRMERRGLITRLPAGAKGVVVAATGSGAQLVTTARPVHAKSLRAHLFDPLGPAKRKALLAMCRMIVGGPPPTAGPRARRPRDRR